MTGESGSLSSSLLKKDARKLHAFSAWLPSSGSGAIFAVPGLTDRGLASRSRHVRTDVRLAFPRRRALEFASNRVRFTSEKTSPARMKRLPLPLQFVRAGPRGAVCCPNSRMDMTL
ncbi:MAG: hypothetical protein E5X23_23960 [Mesorhizobium sp.]|nr:hypothetical protein EJ078_00665 [Mesorhizobium sp. M1A.F.Ca.IN.022.06.1.1]RUV57883.1 hypothetical protein EOA64_25215 [Mesorhizobium sp. M1A.F.Ca.IN.022.02.1.1]RUV69899.1 hypothetical protein EOA50_25580 [Mesorhizobium sp. M1A.F.Ca.IN.020.30.1.1]RWG21145.1 MAG: hypothetical protein EOQ53_08500 [Mesorhizobium sp.]TGQ15741.1 hypothetical protein EN860_024580 [Mesorhizobium sp. M00.F.Ca.ET.217.01.1.1]TGV86978.1 hypothetical protein EN801_025630 [Mesorhizobium sp. M00.F.Ca.ET.158.01.1.1]